MFYQDTNFYIHRVGRTGRAGQSGMSILLFNRSEIQMMKDCERIAVSFLFTEISIDVKSFDKT